MSAVKLLRSILNAIICCCQPKYYVFRFEVVTGEERSNDIDDTNVVGYRFINQGNTDALINGGLNIVSANTVNSLGIPIPGNDVDLTNMMSGGEVDTTIYKVKFGAPPAGLIAENCLIVISKVRATKRAAQMVSLTGHELPIRERPRKRGAPRELEVTAPSSPQQIEYTEG